MQWQVLASVYAAAGVFSFAVWKRSKGISFDRACAAILPPAVLTCFLLFWHEIAVSIYNIPNWNRLQKTFVLASGLPLYYSRESGPVLNTIYGPVAAIAYLPAAWLRSPETAVRTASFLSAVFFFMPVFWLLGARSSKSRRYPFLLCVCFGFFTLILFSLKNAAFNVHADAPALGLLCAAAGFLYFRREKEDVVLLSFSALAAVFAAWTKIVALPALVALPVYVAAADGRKAAVRYAALLGLAAIVSSSAFFSFFGFNNLVFNVLEIPSRHPWKDAGCISAFLSFCDKLSREWLILLLPALLVFSPFKKYFSFRSTLVSRRWMLFLFLALAMLPAAYAGFMKIGGSRNALSYTDYFLTIAIFLAWKESLSGTGNHSRGAGRLKKAVVVLAACLTVGQAIYLFSDSLKPAKPDFVGVAYDYAQRHPGEAYFPTLTPLHWFAERKIYHDVNALMDRQIAGFPITEGQKKAHFPANMKIIAFPDGNDYLGWIRPGAGWGTASSDPELPGFIVYKKVS